MIVVNKTSICDDQSFKNFFSFLPSLHVDSKGLVIGYLNVSVSLCVCQQKFQHIAGTGLIKALNCRVKVRIEE